MTATITEPGPVTDPASTGLCDIESLVPALTCTARPTEHVLTSCTWCDLSSTTPVCRSHAAELMRLSPVELEHRGCGGDVVVIHLPAVGR